MGSRLWRVEVSFCCPFRIRYCSFYIVKWVSLAREIRYSIHLSLWRPSNTVKYLTVDYLVVLHRLASYLVLAQSASFSTDSSSSSAPTKSQVASNQQGFISQQHQASASEKWMNESNEPTAPKDATEKKNDWIIIGISVIGTGLISARTLTWT